MKLNEEKMQEWHRLNKNTPANLALSKLSLDEYITFQLDLIKTMIQKYHNDINLT